MRLSFLRPRTRTAKSLAITPPVPAPGRHGVGIAAIFRDEGRYIGEWVRFHEIAGVRRFVLYDDGSSDGGADLARAAAREAEVIVHPWGLRLGDPTLGVNISAQTLALAHATVLHGGDLRWLAFVDVDEFLVPLQAPTLGAALEPLSAHPAIALPWTMFGRNGHAVPPAGGTVANFTRRWDGPHSLLYEGMTFNVKTILDPCAVELVHVHRSQTGQGEVAWTDAGDRIRLRGHMNPKLLTRERIQLNHYYTRSEADVARKIAKGSGFTSRDPRDAARQRKRIAQVEAAEIEDRAALEFLARRGAADGTDYAAELAALADAGLAAAGDG